MATSSVLADYLGQLLASSPIGATALGVHEHDGVLDDVSAETLAEQGQQRSALLVQLTGVDRTTLAAAEALDVRTAIIALSAAQLSDQNVRPHEHAAYWYMESLGRAISGVVDGDHAPQDERASHLLDRLRATPGFLTQAKRNLDGQVPALWSSMAIAGATGIAQLVQAATQSISTGVPASLSTELDRASTEARSAVSEFSTWLQEQPESEADWACGTEHFDSLLDQVQLVDLDSAQLFEYGQECIARDRAALVAFAAEVDADTAWDEQIDRIKDDCPPAEAFVATYETQMRLARQQTIEHDLVTIPDGEECVMGLVPAYRRFELPIAVMDLSAPFDSGLATQWSITPADPEASPEQLLQHRRDNCFAFAESIAAHETYPGHHLQRVHHKLGTQDSPVRRAFISPQFLEGWGLYTEDLFAEQGLYDDPRIQLYKLRNALWRSLRIVIDVGIHTGRLGFDAAVELLRSEARMDHHMARGEVRRYARHDNPTYPSSYVLGRDRFHALRAAWMSENPDAALRQFHDKVLGYGTLPLAVIEEHLLASAS